VGLSFFVVPPVGGFIVASGIVGWFLQAVVRDGGESVIDDLLNSASSVEKLIASTLRRK
jgi:hypothetical protein